MTTTTRVSARGEQAGLIAALFDHLPEMVVVIAPDGRITLVNERLLEVMGYAEHEVVGTNVFDYVHPDDHAYMVWSWEQREAHPGETGIVVHARGRNADGTWRPLEILGLSLLEDERVGGMVMTMRNLMTGDDIVDSPARLRSLIDRTTDVLMLVDPDGRILYANRRLTSLYGQDSDRVIGRPLTSLLDPDDGPAAARWLRSLAEDGDRATSRIRLRVLDPAGEAHDVEWHGTNQFGDPLIGGIIVSGRDIAELVAMEARVQLQTQQLSYAADHDPLTEQLNRRAFIDHGTRSIAERRLNGDTGDAVVLFCDLDRFKAVNDTYGHQTGDHLLQIVTARLQSCLREGDIVGRYGGDEFAVLLGGHASADGVAALVTRIQEHLAEPQAIGEIRTDVGVTVGVARAPIATVVFDDLLRDADHAMYAAKPRRDPR